MLYCPTAKLAKLGETGVGRNWGHTLSTFSQPGSLPPDEDDSPESVRAPSLQVHDGIIESRRDKVNGDPSGARQNPGGAAHTPGSARGGSVTLGGHRSVYRRTAEQEKRRLRGRGGWFRSLGGEPRLRARRFRSGARAQGGPAWAEDPGRAAHQRTRTGGMEDRRIGIMEYWNIGAMG